MIFFAVYQKRDTKKCVYNSLTISYLQNSRDFFRKN